jgi:hypothetical protein
MSWNRLYIGHNLTSTFNEEDTLFWSRETPTQEKLGHKFDYVTGPFKSKKAAMYMVNHYWCLTVAEAERAVRSA